MLMLSHYLTSCNLGNVFQIAQNHSIRNCFCPAGGAVILPRMKTTVHHFTAALLTYLCISVLGEYSSATLGTEQI